MKKKTAVDYAVKNTFFLYVGNLVIEVVNLFISIYIIRKLSVETFGLYSFILGSMLFVQIFTISSISTVFNRFFPEFSEKRRFSLFGKLFMSSYLIVFFSLIIISVLILIFSSNFASFFKLEDLPKYKFEIILYMITYIFLLLSKAATSSTLLQKEAALSNISASVIRIVVYLVMLSKINLSLILLIEFFINGFNAITQSYIILKHLNSNRNNESSEKIDNLKPRIIRYGLLSFFNEMGAGMISKASSYYVISAMSNSFLLGQYSFAYKVNDIFLKIFPLYQISNVLRPIFFRKYVNKPDDSELLKRMYLFLYKFLFWLLSFLCFYFLSVSDIIVKQVFDPKYADSITITNIIFMFTLFNAFQIPLSYVVLSLEKLEINLYSKIFLIYNIIGSIFAMRQYGLIGVSVVLGTSMLFKNLFILFGIRKTIKLSFPFYSMFRSTLISTVVFLAIYYFKAIHFSNPYIFLLLSFILAALAYFVLTKILSPFNEKEKEIINMMLAKTKIKWVKI
ncbi:MAG: oligosaccharide flippase family protein [bacterium]|nr:oligosaccharide flippase family protein [bacterium]